MDLIQSLENIPAPPKESSLPDHPHGSEALALDLTNLRSQGIVGPTRRPDLDLNFWEPVEDSSYFNSLDRIYGQSKRAFFTKEAFRALVGAFDAWKRLANSKHQLHLTDLKGRTFEFNNECRQQLEWGADEDTKWSFYLEEPVVNYAPIDHLKSFFRGEDNPTYLPLTATYNLSRRYKKGGRPGSLVRDYSADPSMPFDIVQSRFRQDRDDWRKTAHFEHLEAIFDAITPPNSATKIIAFACGALYHKSGRDRARAARQHALMMLIKA